MTWRKQTVSIGLKTQRQLRVTERSQLGHHYFFFRSQVLCCLPCYGLSPLLSPRVVFSPRQVMSHRSQISAFFVWTLHGYLYVHFLPVKSHRDGGD